MAVKLELNEYCEDCDMFKSVTEKQAEDIVVSCKNEKLCSKLYSRITKGKEDNKISSKSLKEYLHDEAFD